MSHSATSRRTPIRTAIIERSPLVRAGLKHMLAESHFRVCLECCEVCELPESWVRGDQTNLVLVGVAAPDEQDLSQIESLRKTHQHLSIVVISEGASGENFLAFMDAGADCSVDRDNINAATLLQTLDLLMSRKTVVPLALIHLMKDRWREPTPPGPSFEMNGDIDISISKGPTRQLAAKVDDLAAKVESSIGVVFSGRERVILHHLMQGAPNKQIARELAVAEATVKVHVKALLRKIRVSNRTQAAMWAIGHGFNA
jgi:two-component system, NarL family, nitrate/nitrite response regulator NarL